MNIYYVYAYLRKDLTPYYIGKGKGNRAYENHKHISVPAKSFIQILAHKLSELEALLLETKLIKLYGRKDLGTGILRNMTNGGDGTSGRIVTEQTRNKISYAKKGCKDSETTKLKKSLSKLGKPSNAKGHTQTHEHISKCNAARATRRELMSNEKKQQIRDAISAGNKGKTKNYTTCCAKKFICRISDKKEFSKASAGKYLKDLKQFF